MERFRDEQSCDVAIWADTRALSQTELQNLVETISLANEDARNGVDVDLIVKADGTVVRGGEKKK